LKEAIMEHTSGTSQRALWAATGGFFGGFAAVALFGPSAKLLKDAMGLGPMEVGLLVAAPSLTGSLLRIPFAAWVDTTGGRKPFLVLLSLALCGMVGLSLVFNLQEVAKISRSSYPLLLLLGLFCGCGIATFSVGIGQVSYWFPQKKQGRALALYAGLGNLAPGVFTLVLPLALARWGLSGAYLAWTALLALGLLAYAALGADAPYFQLRRRGVAGEHAREVARQLGQELFPKASLVDSLRVSARNWRTWFLLAIYFATFGGFIALTAWLPTYFREYLGLGSVAAGGLAALYSLLTSGVRVAGGVLADRLRSGGENTTVLALLFMLAGALVLTGAEDLPLALPGVVLLGLGMGLANAAVFKMVPQAVPEAVGGAAGWVGGLGALGGFVIPPMLAFAVADLGQRGYAVGFIVFVFLALMSLTAAWILKYASHPVAEASKA